MLLFTAGVLFPAGRRQVFLRLFYRGLLPEHLTSKSERERQQWWRTVCKIMVKLQINCHLSIYRHGGRQCGIRKEVERFSSDSFHVCLLFHLMVYMR